MAQQFQPPDTSSYLGDATAGYIQDQFQVPPQSPIVPVLQNFPTVTETAGWNAIRGSRTILGGGFDEGRIANRLSRIKGLRRVYGPESIWAKMPGTRRARGSNPFGPRNWGRLSHHELLYEDPINPASRKNRKRIAKGLEAEPEGWSPYNFMAHFGNSAANTVIRSAVNQSTSMSGKMVSGLKNAGILTEDVEAKMAAGGKSAKNEGEFISRGMFARMHASHKVMNKGSTLSEKKVNSLNKFLSVDVERGGFGAGWMEDLGETALKGEDYAHLVGASMKGRMSQYAMGYIQTAAGPNGAPAGYARDKIANTAGKEAYLKGTARATASMEKLGIEKSGGKFLIEDATKGLGKKLGLEVGEEVGSMALMRGGMEGAGLAVAQFIPGVNVAVDIAMAAMMTYDITKMGIGLMKGAVQTAADAGKSFKGSIGKGVMGMGYRDTTVAATSRQRGVMAIQNSMLNARSVLGSEAASVHARFG